MNHCRIAMYGVRVPSWGRSRNLAVNEEDRMGTSSEM